MTLVKLIFIFLAASVIKEIGKRFGKRAVDEIIAQWNRALKRMRRRRLYSARSWAFRLG